MWPWSRRTRVGGTCLHAAHPGQEFLETALVFRTVAGAKDSACKAEQPTVDSRLASPQAEGRRSALEGPPGPDEATQITTVIGTGTLAPNKTVRSTTAPS